MKILEKSAAEMRAELSKYPSEVLSISDKIKVLSKSPEIFQTLMTNIKPNVDWSKCNQEDAVKSLIPVIMGDYNKVLVSNSDNKPTDIKKAIDELGKSKKNKKFSLSRDMDGNKAKYSSKDSKSPKFQFDVVDGNIKFLGLYSEDKEWNSFSLADVYLDNKTFRSIDGTEKSLFHLGVNALYIKDTNTYIYSGDDYHVCVSSESGSDNCTFSVYSSTYFWMRGYFSALILALRNMGYADVINELLCQAWLERNPDNKKDILNICFNERQHPCNTVPTLAVKYDSFGKCSFCLRAKDNLSKEKLSKRDAVKFVENLLRGIAYSTNIPESNHNDFVRMVLSKIECVGAINRDYQNTVVKF